MQHAGNTLRKIYSKSLGEQKDAPLLAWPLACGSRIAGRTSAVSFAEGVLTVSVPDETWRANLQGFSAQYVAALNSMIKDHVSRIEFIPLHTAKR